MYIKTNTKADYRKMTGFTLIELVVVISIIAVLTAIAIPAVQKARATANRVQCANNLRQHATAAVAYQVVFGAFPAGMRWQGGKDPMRLSSWHTQILPFLDDENSWRAAIAAYKTTANPRLNPPHTLLSTVKPIFVCPADGRGYSLQFAPRDKINVALTSYLGVSGRDYSTPDGVLFRDSRVRFADITDGTSNTLLAGERPPSADFQFGWWYAGAGQKFTGSADMLMGVEEQNILTVTAGSCPPGTYKFAPGSFSNQCDMFHFWSPHSGGAHFLFADGAVRFLDYSAAPLLPALASRAGGEAVSPP